MKGSFIFAMPGSGKTSAIQKLNYFGTHAVDADFGYYRQFMFGIGTRQDELTPSEQHELRCQFYSRYMKKTAEQGYLCFCNEPLIAEMAAKDGWYVKFILPIDPYQPAFAVKRRDGESDFSEMYLENAVQWAKEWSDVALDLSRRYDNVLVTYERLPYDMLYASAFFLTEQV